jgi:dTDP-3-amino-3,4,6-trideoxy-alpha-D-glucose transaminase
MAITEKRTEMSTATAAGVGGDTVRFVALDRQHAPLKDELVAAFTRLLGSSAFTLGTEVDAFETEFGAYCEAEHCVGVASGTAALTLALAAAGIGAGDEVIVPAHTFIASALGAVHLGATPVLVDVDPGTGLLDPAAVRASIGPRTAAIVAVHLYGQVCEMDALQALARAHGLLLLEDAAQAHGARYRGRPAGSLADVAAFSFYPSKNLGALGDGGAVCTRDPELAARLRRLRNLGQQTKGDHVEVGYNERLDGLQAALLRIKLRHLDEWNAARRARAREYRERLTPEVVLLAERPDGECVYHLMPARFADRDGVAAGLRERGIETGIHYAPAMHGHGALLDCAVRHGELPEAEAWAREELSLPMHPDLGAAEVERVVEALHAVLPALRGSSGGARC